MQKWSSSALVNDDYECGVDKSSRSSSETAMSSYYAQGIPLHTHPRSMQQPQQQLMDQSSYAHATAAPYINNSSTSNTNSHEHYVDAYANNGHVGHHSSGIAGVFGVPAPD